MTGMKIGLKSLSLVALLGVSACAAFANASAHSVSLTGFVWSLTEIAPRGEVIKPGALLRKPTLKVMPGGLLVGDTGCNGFAGWATVKGQSLKVTTLKLSGTSNCSDHALSLESDFVNLLESATRFEISGQKLTIHGAGNRFMTLQGATKEKSVTGELPQLTSMKGDWQLTNLTYKGQPVTVPSDSVLTIQDTGDGVEVRGKAGCNTMFGKVTLTGRTISVTDLGMTMMLCENMQSENAVVDILRVPLTVVQNSGIMTWRNDQGKITLKRVTKAQAAFDASNLIGLAFTLRTVNETPARTTLNPVTIEFSEGRVAGSDGCNTFSGSAVWNGNQVTVSDLISTRMFCPDMTEFPSLPALLRLQPTAELNGNTLKLTANGVEWSFTEQR